MMIGIITFLGLFITGCTPFLSGTNLVGSASAVNTPVSVIPAPVPDNSVPANQITSGSISGTIGPATISLGSAASFAGLGGSAGITNQGLLTVINGDIGTTGASTMMTGFFDSIGDKYTVTLLNNGMVNGRIYTAAPPPGGAAVGGTVTTFARATQALADANTAFNNLAAMPGGRDPAKGQLGGLVLAPGIYKAKSGAFLITGADLTLDARGDSNAVFVFQMASSLTVGTPDSPRSVNLINGAQANNVFWQVGSAASVNGSGGGTMSGTIISSATTTISSPGNTAVVTLNGRALALNASVTMVNTVINVPVSNAFGNQPATGSTSVITPTASVDLGSASSFASFGGNAGMTNQGLLTVINGDIGTTGTSTMMTGWHDSVGDIYTVTPLNNGRVNGRIYTAAPPPRDDDVDGVGGNATTLAIATQALADMRTAFNNLASLPGGRDPGDGQLGGLILAPGIYKSNSGAFLITKADLTLDARGDANAVFVFQMASSLTVGAPEAPRSVNLINGAQAKNVFWQVGSAATINGAGGGSMSGTIISYASTTFSTAGNTFIVTLNGRALSLTASVTMVNTVINAPVPDVPIINVPITLINTGFSSSITPISLGSAGNFVILTKTGVSTTGTTAIAGNIGVSPGPATYMTGFGLVADTSNIFSTSSLVTGKIYAADYATPTSVNLATAVSDMETAYTDADRRTANASELYGGDISGRTFLSGIYKWSSTVLINNEVTLTGGADDIWIFRIGQNLTVGSGAIVTLSGGAQPQNIFWQVAGNTTLGTTSDFKGIILCKTHIAIQTGASLKGRALAQTAVTLDAAKVTP